MHLITNVRSSLQSGAVLVWLMGDTRLIREDAKLYFRKANKEDEDDDGEDWKDEKSDNSETDLEKVDYAQALQHIDNILPVKQPAGRPVALEVLRQFGLVDNKRVDQFLASAFAKSAGHSEALQKASNKDEVRQAPKASQGGPPNRLI